MMARSRKPVQLPSDIPDVPERLSSLIPPEHRNKMAVLRKSSEVLKRKVSQLSTVSKDSHAHEEFLNAKVDELGNRDEQLRLLQDGLRQSFNTGELPENDFKELYKETFGKRAKIALEDVTIRRQRHRILELLAGNAEGLEPNMAMAYAAILTQQFVEKTKNWGPKRTGKEQTAWGNQLRVWYNAVSPTDKKAYWCPITKMYGNKHYRCHAHIAPYALGYENLAYLFGEPMEAGHDIVWRNENALVLDKGLETAFDKGRFVLVPIPTLANEPTRWKTIVLYDSDRSSVIGGSNLTYNVGHSPYSHKLLLILI